ncbi:MAG: Gfo/Idh/MocA family oxidoreductase [Treponema sp.]|nr:Gfo/Idh/MocA family oxidoreductase [Treponema sp.]
MEKIRAAIVGLGRIASLLEEDRLREKPCTHAGAITANPDCVLAGGCDTDEERRRLFAGRWGAAVYTSAAEMIRAQTPQILVIATHPDSHYHYCRLAADCGVPVVICEKPLADTLSAARKIAGFERSGSITIITNHERRYSADYIKTKEIFRSGELGALLSVRAVLYMGKTKRLLDVFWHDGTHLADVIMFLTGLALKHRKRWGAKLTASSGTAWLEGELLQPKPESACPPIPVTMEIGAERDHLVFEIEFSCMAGRLRIGNGVFEVWKSGESPYAEKFRSLKKTTEGFEGPTGYFANMIANAVSCVRDPGNRPASSAADGLAVIEYLHSVRAWR